MSFDFWAVVNNPQTQNEAAAESEKYGGGFMNFVEPGEYDLTIKHAEMRQTKTGYQKLTLRVQADSGESGFWDLLVGHGGGQSQAAKIAQQSLALILKYSGANAFGPEALAGVRVKAWVNIEEGSDGIERPKFRPIGAAEGARKAAHTTSAAKPAPATKPAPKPRVDEDIPNDNLGDDDIPF